jgi:hypothetical protein
MGGHSNLPVCQLMLRDRALQLPTDERNTVVQLPGCCMTDKVNVT